MHAQKENKRKILIDKAIKNSINNFLKSLERTSGISPRIDGEIPDVRGYIRTFDNIDLSDKENVIVNEGLIKTYPIDKTVNYIIQKYGLTKHQVQINHYNNGIATIDTICVLLHQGVDSNTIGDIKHDFYTCGYFNNQPITHVKNTNYFALIFEPKFTEDVSEVIRQKCSYLYHSAPKIYMNKIIKNGLIPKSKNSIFFYPDRTFLMVGDMLNNNQLKILKNIQVARNKSINTDNPIETKEYIMVVVEVAKLPIGIKFYSDPSAGDAVFTYDNIPPSAIKKIEPFTL